MRVKGIIFDYGGTIDSDGIHWSEILWEAYCKYKIPVSKEIFREAYVYAERALAHTVYIQPEHNFYHMLKIKVEIELKYLVENKILDIDYSKYCEDIARFCYDRAHMSVKKAENIISQLYAKYPMVLVSNFYGNIQTVLNDFGIGKYFGKIIESAVVGVRKPDPQIFRLGVEALGLKPEETVVVGDSYKKDILPATSIGCAAIWLKGKGWTDEEDKIAYEQTIDTIVKLKELLL